MLEKIQQLVTEPIYLVRKSNDYFTIDKISFEHEKSKRTRYILRDMTCSCLGYVKFKSCKHLFMLENNYEAGGIGPERAMFEAQEITEHLKGESPPDYTEEELEQMPDLVRAIVIDLSEKVVDIVRVCYLKKWPDKKSVAVTLNFLK